jgi:thiol-disulfide isomerase/thioredoxin
VSEPVEAGVVTARSRWAGRALVAIIAAVFVIDVAAVVQDWDKLRPVGSGASAPDFALPRIGERGRIGPESVSLSSLRGRVVIIDFWETWCHPCREAMPAIDRVAGQYEDEVIFLSVCSDGTRRAAEARKLVDRLAPRAQLVADGGAVADRYGVSTIPHMVVIGRDGSVVSVHRRYRGPEAVESDLRAAVTEALGR